VTLVLAIPAGAVSDAWHGVGLARLDVTSGALAPDGRWLATTSGEMRAVVRDGGRHASRVRLSFRLRGPSDEVVPLGSGLVRQQIGLKLHAQDPCNLVYVMWRSAPDTAIAIQVKRNPGQSTSAQCGNAGYTTLATVPAAAVADGATHVLEARTRRAADGALIVSVFADGALWHRQDVSAALAAGLEGPAGVRSDNGSYAFRLATRR
jgi:hypothetical protein